MRLMKCGLSYYYVYSSSPHPSPPIGPTVSLISLVTGRPREWRLESADHRFVRSILSRRSRVHTPTCMFSPPYHRSYSQHAGPKRLEWDREPDSMLEICERFKA